jgi:hypothetical protein
LNKDLEINVLITERPLEQYDLIPSLKFEYFEVDSLCNISDDPQILSLKTDK